MNRNEFENNELYSLTIFETLAELCQFNHIVITLANADTMGKYFRDMAFKLKNKYTGSITVVNSFGKENYFSAMKSSKFLLGNTSSGILEAPSFKIGTVNIGNRQEGRIKAESVIDCRVNKKEIKKSLNKIYSKTFQKLLKTVQNPYNNGLSSKKIIKQLKRLKLENVLKKNFFDIDFNI